MVWKPGFRRTLVVCYGLQWVVGLLALLQTGPIDAVIGAFVGTFPCMEAFAIVAALVDATAEPLTAQRRIFLAILLIVTWTVHQAALFGVLAFAILGEISWSFAPVMGLVAAVVGGCAGWSIGTTTDRQGAGWAVADRVGRCFLVLYVGSAFPRLALSLLFDIAVVHPWANGLIFLAAMLAVWVRFFRVTNKMTRARELPSVVAFPLLALGVVTALAEALGATATPASLLLTIGATQVLLLTVVARGWHVRHE